MQEGANKKTNINSVQKENKNSGILPTISRVINRPFQVINIAIFGTIAAGGKVTPTYTVEDQLGANYIVASISCPCVSNAIKAAAKANIPHTNIFLSVI